MDSCDVLIVGGGPAGSSCAWGLRNSGLNVVILDRQFFPRDKICGGWITPATLRNLEIDPDEYAQKCVLQPITGFRVGSIGSSALETDYGAPVSYGILRREFDAYLLERCGANLLLGTPLARVDRSGDGWIVNDRIRARVVVGAGGHFCPVARLVAGRNGAESPVVAQETEFEMDGRQRAGCRVRGDKPELYFCSDMQGYGWCFRKGNVLNIGLGRADPHRLSAHVAGFLEFLSSAGRISFDVPALHGHAYLLHGTSTRNAVADGLLLVGDAAGLACPQSGEGIRPAVESGLLAAKNIAKANGIYKRQAFDDYRMQIAAKHQAAIARIGRLLPPQWISSIAKQLLKKPWFVRDVVLDEWFLASNRP
ncbi:MAG: NAD(P)/FAD-dependent oxidoreductase [Acidobacteria bacterium]|nr:NAD(P)/FAD-dependent oxidoreductase [Acidobacteriota bacterium]